MLVQREFFTAVFLACVAGAPSWASDSLFETTVAPLFAERCVACHNDGDPKGSLSLQASATALGESDSGRTLVPGSPDDSLLLDMISGDKPEMPKQAEPLSDDEVAAVRDWIADGAEWPHSLRLKARDTWWSRQPLHRPTVPKLPPEQQERVRTTIDAFVLKKLGERGLEFSPEADARTFVRRLVFDLIGLPPTPDQIAEFQQQVDQYRREHPQESADQLPQPVVEQLADELLASPQYGERWARHWLDVVKYADTCGYDKDKLRPNAWPYRDYVIRSLNEDKPYTRFVEEQIAGDVLYPDEPEGILGLGFIAAGPWDFIGHVEVSESKLDGKVARNMDRDDMVSNTLNTFCSVTIQCARCHNHKFDPFTQQHYYGLQAVFAAVDRAERAYDDDPQIESQRKTLGEQVATLKKQLDQHAENAELKTQLKAAEQQLAELPPRKFVYAAATEFPAQGNFHSTAGKPRAVHVLHRGNIDAPREPATPGALPLPTSELANFTLPSPHDEGERRAALARWITDEKHPLTWRSIVNRVWLYHFGQGIVDSPNDFGRMGQRPSHPELLDWLAVEFRDGGQSLKQLHRLIVTSRTYRQSSAHDAKYAAIDSGNRYLWRMNRRRLEAEEIRDAILAVSGQLDLQMGGPGYYLFELEKEEHSPHYEYHKFDPNDPSTHRRTIYRFIVRSQPDPLMTTLDCADSSQSTPKRDETLNALQSLSLLNNRFNLVMAKHFAQRVEQEHAEINEQVTLALQLAIGREPTTTEQEQLTHFAKHFGMENLCRTIFNLSEFVYLD